LGSVPETKPPVDRTTELQSKLYQAAKRDPARRFHALYDKLYLPYLLQTAWEQVRQNRGAAGIDRQTLAEIEALGVEAFLAEVAQALREKRYRPQPVRRVLIPKRDGKQRPLGIPTVQDRVVQAAVKLLLEPIFEAGCPPEGKGVLRDGRPSVSVRGSARKTRWGGCNSTRNRATAGWWMPRSSSSSTRWITSN
jgi:RNA-directed DNA polymerase